jgi:type IV pilus assembly protein PilP
MTGMVISRLGNSLVMSAVKTKIHHCWATVGVLIIAAVLLSGCGQGMNDLQQYVEEVKARKSAPIKKTPTVNPPPLVDYSEGLKDPFDSSVLNKVIKVSVKSSGVSPDPNRTPEYLENYPLDTLRMVGTMSQEATLWALIKTPDATIQRVAVGNYIGQNYGKIVQVSDTRVGLSEIIPDGFGGWMKRATSIALSE